MNATNKPINQKAWWLVLPVLLCVAFSAIVPLMTVVNYSVQESFGENEFFWSGVQWFEEMLRSAWLLDWQAKAGAAHGRIGRCYRTLGEYDKAEYHLGLALDLFTRARDHRGVAGAEDDLGKVSFLRGDYQRALDRHGRALDLRRALGDPRSIALAVHNLAQVHHASGNHFEAMARFDGNAKKAAEVELAGGDDGPPARDVGG